MTFDDVTATVLPRYLTLTLFPYDGVIDLNGDGWLEIIPETGRAIFWNVGDGMFEEQPVDDFCCGMQWAVADFDGDGRVDIHHATSNFPDQSDRILWNRD